MYPSLQQPFGIPSFPPPSGPMFPSPPMGAMPVARGGNFLTRLFGGGSRLFGGGGSPLSQGAPHMLSRAPNVAQGFGGFMGGGAQTGLAQGASRLLGGAPAGLTQGAGGLLGGNTVGGLFSGGGLSNVISMIQNTQRVLGVVQSVVPMVQQYGPLLKSMPQIYQILKTPKESTNDSTEPNEKQVEIEAETEDSVNNEADNSTNKVADKPNKVTVTSKKEHASKRKIALETIQGPPRPKLYV